MGAGAPDGIHATHPQLQIVELSQAGCDGRCEGNPPDQLSAIWQFQWHRMVMIALVLGDDAGCGGCNQRSKWITVTHLVPFFSPDMKMDNCKRIFLYKEMIF